VVEEALRNEIKRIKFKRALQENFGAWKSEHRELAKGARAFVRSLRKSSARQP